MNLAGTCLGRLMLHRDVAKVHKINIGRSISFSSEEEGNSSSIYFANST